MSDSAPNMMFLDGSPEMNYGGGSESANTASLWARAFGEAVVNTSSGINVNPQSAVAISAYYACMYVIAEDCAKIELQAAKKNGLVRTPVNDHPLLELFNVTPDGEMTGMDFRQTMVANALGWGNAYAEIERAGTRVVALHWIHPERVSPKRDDNGSLIYEVRNDKSVEPSYIPAYNMFHIRNRSGDGLVGYSVARLAIETLGLARATELFGGKFFGSGASPKGVLTVPGQLSVEAERRIQESWNAAYGGVTNASKTAVLGHGLTYQRISIPQNECQFIETAQFSVEQICRWFRVAPHKIQHLLRSTNNNIEHQSLEHTGDTLMPWLERIEAEIRLKLIQREDWQRTIVEHDMRRLLRGDAASRAAFYNSMYHISAISPNEVRASEGMNPYEGGDVFYSPVNMTPANSDERRGEENVQSGSDSVSGDTGNMQAAILWTAKEYKRLLTKEAKAVTGANKYTGEARNQRLVRFFDSLKVDIANELAGPFELVGEHVSDEFVNDWITSGLAFALTSRHENEEDYFAERCSVLAC